VGDWKFLGYFGECICVVWNWIWLQELFIFVSFVKMLGKNLEEFLMLYIPTK
jgi:hypothetical protein